MCVGGGAAKGSCVVERCHLDPRQSAGTSDGKKSGRQSCCFNAGRFAPLEVSCSFPLKCVRLNRLTSYLGWEGQEDFLGGVAGFSLSTPPFTLEQLWVGTRIPEQRARSGWIVPLPSEECAHTVWPPKTHAVEKQRRAWCVFNKPF